MKRIFFILSFIAITSLTTFSQVYKTEKCAIFYFNADTDENIGMTFNKAQLEDIFFNVITVLSDSSALKFYSIDYLKNKVPYSFDDFPMAMAKKAAKSNMSKCYAKIDVSIRTTGITTNKSSSVKVGGIGKGKGTMKSQLKVTTKLKIVDEKGEEILNIKADAETKDKIEFNRDDLIIGRLVLTSKEINAQTQETFQKLIFQSALNLAKMVK